MLIMTTLPSNLTLYLWSVFVWQNRLCLS